MSYVRYEFGYTTASVRLDLFGHVKPFDTCRQLCNDDTFCLGFAYQSDSSRCALSGSCTLIWYPECPFCSFSKKIWLVSGIQTCALFTTSLGYGAYSPRVNIAHILSISGVLYC